MTPTSTLPGDVLERCPCLRSSPYAAEASKLVATARGNTTTSAWALHKILAVYQICFSFRRMEQTLPADPAATFREILTQITAGLEIATAAQPEIHFSLPLNNACDLVSVTTDHYGNLFSSFDPEKYYEEPSELLGQRLTRNGFDLGWLGGRRVLDAGCGNGRYSYALGPIDIQDSHDAVSCDSWVSSSTGLEADRWSSAMS